MWTIGNVADIATFVLTGKMPKTTTISSQVTAIKAEQAKQKEKILVAPVLFAKQTVGTQPLINQAINLPGATYTPGKVVSPVFATALGKSTTGSKMLAVMQVKGVTVSMKSSTTATKIPAFKWK